MAKTPITPLYDKLKADVLALEADVVKTDKGNHKAGVRTRKVLQQLKNQAQDMRLVIVEQ